MDIDDWSLWFMALNSAGLQKQLMVSVEFISARDSRPENSVQLRFPVITWYPASAPTDWSSL